MKYLYFRKSNFSLDEIEKRLQDKLKSENFIFKEVYRQENKFLVYGIVFPEMIEEFVKLDLQLLAFYPLNIFVINQENEIIIGVFNPEIITTILNEYNSNYQKFVDFENKIKEIVDEISGGEKRKIESIKLYATTTCPYCAQEKAFLDSNNIKYDYVLVDINPIAAEEMIKKTGQQGVPVTEIIYNDGDSDFIIGFDRQRLTRIIKELKES
ncbi:MAG: hypothetical protein C4278_02005 [Patescibacteria group bacterium]